LSTALGKNPTPWRLIAAFATVYLVWGSSYVATKVMVLELPPLFAAGIRFLLGGILLGVFAASRGASLPQGPREWRHCAVMGALTILVANGIANLALQHLASNQAALLNASSALWIALLGTLGPRGHPLGRGTQVGLVLGFLGVGLVMWPRGSFAAANVGWQLAIVFGCLCWAVATAYFRAVRPNTATLMFTAVQMVCGGAMLSLVGIAAGQAQRFTLSGTGLLAFLYLTIFSSGIAYAAFAYLLTHTTPAKLGTYAYVNPVVAALVGWAAFGERLVGVQLAGTAVILAGVLLVTLTEPPLGGAPPAKRSG
jgi:drug/metabolite transporter (DMT)-like permease